MPHPTRLLGLPPRGWLVLSPCLVAGALLAPQPGAPADPSAGLLDAPVLVALAPATGGVPRVVSFAERDRSGPVVALGLQTTRRSSVDRHLGWRPESAFPELGFFERRDAWSYELTATRYDEAGKSLPHGDRPLPKEEAAALRPLAVAELDRRSGPGRSGARLAKLLDEGAERESRFHWQNLLMIAAWSSIPLMLCAGIRPRPAGERKPATSKLNEFFP
ncbi:hypothetical protein [Paludisphaera soli]|uniref:hypothetical protein n=1 Tax=Paludisphaera soli TaxID=2712865 RepID=UPI0013EE3C83|nr:hypothetical protein [Paludisphaera soli]